MKIETIEISNSNYSLNPKKDEVYVDDQIKRGIQPNSGQPRLDNRRVPSSKELLEKKQLGDVNMSVSEKAIIEAIERANEAIQGVNTSFEFSIHEKTRQIMVKVLNRDTKEVIREIPPEKILDMVAKIWEMVGIIVDERR